MPSREPPVGVRRQLRREVGFGCPVPECGNPYLQYHHFDPPWAEEQHHDPDRMIALCAPHHDKAAAWTVAQCRAMKSVPEGRPDVRGKFEWMRDDVLAVIGGDFYYETPNMVVYRGSPVIWFKRDDQRRLMLSLRVLTTSPEPRLRMEDNDWIIPDGPEDVECPPNGSWLRVRYRNGDDVSVRFREWPNVPALGAVYPRALDLGSSLHFPLVTAEISFRVGGANIKFTPKTSNLGTNKIADNISAYCANGLAFDNPVPQLNLRLS